MTPYQQRDHPRVRDLLLQAAEKLEADRAEFLDCACGDEPGLRQEVQALLAALKQAQEFAPDPTLPLPESASEGLGSRIGRYTLVQLIGEGGFGSVFRARQEQPVRRDVALKIIKLGMDTKQVIARFNAERQALAMMDHPHIARVYDAGATDTGRPYFVMELVEGVSITPFCDDHKLLLRKRLELFIEVCQAVQHAHTKGIIHRDLKPSNVLVASQDGVSFPKVIDFGIAKATQAKLTEHTLLTEKREWMGTPHYMSPEQTDGGNDIDTRSDIYSLGVLLYELLSGATPFDFTTAGYSEIQRIIREVEPPPPSARVAQPNFTDARALRRELSGDLDRIVLKAMEKDRARRYETASALASDIQRYLRNEPVTARPAGTVYRFRKLVRRNRVVFGSTAAVLLALVVGLAFSTWGLSRAKSAEHSQEILRDDADAKRYVSDMNLVQQALAVCNLGRARELLDSHRPKPGEKDRRGWEWRYLWQQCRSDAFLELRPKHPSAAPVTSLAVSSEGRWLAVGQADGGLTIWDLPARQEIATPGGGDRDVLVAFAPRQPLLVYSSSSAAPSWRYELHVWDLIKEKEVAVRLLNHACVGLACSRDGQSFVTSTWGPNGQVTLWRVPGLDIARQFNVPQSTEIQLIGSPFAIQGDLHAAAVAPDGFVTLVNLSTGTAIRSGGSRAQTLAFSPDGGILAICPGSSMGVAESGIGLLDANTGVPLGAALEGHLAWVGALVFWPDGRTLASASADRTIRLWDISDPVHAKPIGRPLRGHTQEVLRLALLPGGRTLVSGAKDGSVCLWDVSVPHNERWPQTLRPSAWDFARTGATLIAVDRHGLVERVEGRAFQHRQIITRVDDGFDGVKIDDHGRMVGCSFPDGAVRLWNIEAMRQFPPHPLAGSSDRSHDVTPEGYFLIHLVSNTTPPEADPINDRVIKSWHPQGGATNTVVEWDCVQAREMDRWHPAGMGAAASLIAQGTLRFIIDRSGVGSIKDRATGRQIDFDLLTREVEAATTSPDGNLLAVASGRFATVELWNTADLITGGKLASRSRLTGFTLPPHSVAFSPDGKRLAVGGNASEAVKLFDVESRQEVLTLAATGSNFDKTCFSADGNVLGASNDEGELHLWRAPTQAEIDAAEASHPTP